MVPVMFRNYEFVRLIHHDGHNCGKSSYLPVSLNDKTVEYIILFVYFDTSSVQNDQIKNKVVLRNSGSTFNLLTGTSGSLNEICAYLGY